MTSARRFGGGDGWFGGDEGRDADETAFLARLRELAGGWDILGLSPADDTSTIATLAPLYVDLDVPGLPIPRRTLQVGYWPGGPRGPALYGVWGDEYLLEDHDGNDPEDLTVVGVHAAPEQFADWAADWLLRQLRRPVVREEWRSGDRVSAATWRLADTGRVLGRQGRSLRRLLRRASDQVVPVR